MSKWVRLESNIIREIIPDAATIPSVAHWYGGDFAATCREAPDEVEQGWVYDPDTGAFSPPPEPGPAPAPEPDYTAFVAELYTKLMEEYANE